MPVTQELLDEIALTPQEYALICQRLGREPNPLELGMFGALWSEHCGYKHSKNLLKRFPSSSPRLLVPSGEENAGVVSIGDGWAIAMKIESHNHPSAVEPFQGAATGVGGIVRDILTMGARPIALLNSLRFGPLSDARARYLFHGVVGGISWYGNCIGVPDVGGEVYFSPAYLHNPLVNAMCVGLLRGEHLVRARASEPGALLLLVGADTGRDGIHGASGLASRTFSGERELRPTVQVGNPFLEKVLIEACLEALERCREGIVGMQDLGAAGLTSATVESAGRGGCGVTVDVARVPRREAGMTPYEVMLSESQERMLLIIRPAWLERVKGVFDKWDLTSAVVGQVTDDGMVRVYDGPRLEAVVPVRLLVAPPLYDLRPEKPQWLDALQREDLSALGEPPLSPSDALLRLLASPNIASREPIYRQYDHMVLLNTLVPPGVADSAVLRIKGSATRIALACDGNGRLVFLEPWAGGAIAVAEACRNLACVGAEPVALTDGLNFGDPERPLVAYQMTECINGMASACTALGVPVISGNVSLYNETDGQPIYPTPIVGALGVLERHVTAGFQKEGDVVFLLGASEVVGDPRTLAGSEFLEIFFHKVAGRPAIDLALEARVQRLCRRAVQEGLLSSAHDCSEGGLAVALAECAILGGKGFRGEFALRGNWAPGLFGEAQSRILVSLPEGNIASLLGLAQAEGVPLVRLGTVGGDRVVVPGLLDLPLDSLRRAWKSGLKTP
ncbi:Phosphoribosylformylglycinamidine synthase subunit PurL [bacterium HR23]|nr:Phosphoribosylformylglycinamidine synthase subunit PurL [bacterium HR23]